MWHAILAALSNHATSGAGKQVIVGRFDKSWQSKISSRGQLLNRVIASFLLQRTQSMTFSRSWHIANQLNQCKLFYAADPQIECAGRHAHPKHIHSLKASEETVNLGCNPIALEFSLLHLSGFVSSSLLHGNASL